MIKVENQIQIVIHLTFDKLNVGLNNVSLERWIYIQSYIGKTFFAEKPLLINVKLEVD